MSEDEDAKTFPDGEGDRRFGLIKHIKVAVSPIG